MESILDIIKKEISQDYYQQNYPNDGQRFVACAIFICWTNARQRMR